MKLTPFGALRLATGLCVLGTLGAQSGARFDGTSETAFRASVVRVSAELSAADKALLEQTLLVMEKFAARKDLVRRRLDGATAPKVLEFGRKIMSQLDANQDGKLDAKEMMSIATEIAKARIRANESAAIATLRNVASAQAQLQAMGVVDTDQDGNGEYGYFAEMTGAAPLRDASGKSRALLQPPVLSRAFRVQNSRVQRTGYLYQMWLPGADGTAVPEARTGGVDREQMPAAKHAAKRWVCYAWPVKNGTTGNRVFVTDQTGRVWISDNRAQRYGGVAKPPQPYAAMARGAKTLSSLAVRTARNDRGTWEREPDRSSYATPPRRR